MSDKLSDDERARLDAEVKRDYEMSAKWPFDAPDAWWDGSKRAELAAVDSAHAAARAIIRDLSDRGGIKRGFENISEETRVEIVTKAAAIIRAASPAPAIPAFDPVAIIEQRAIRAATHSQYPVETDFDHGYAKARRDAAHSIRALKAAPAISKSDEALLTAARRALLALARVAERDSAFQRDYEYLSKAIEDAARKGGGS
ncbi:hypothetical protein [Burkholderia gladioli]|uniref:hypothetical protein n=1 Tax=Burkholderia gladioli TaxID=28095 RepID=UPI00163FDA61|nr:hypothetical protein [Burkholderia gladioli]